MSKFHRKLISLASLVMAAFLGVSAITAEPANAKGKKPAAKKSADKDKDDAKGKKDSKEKEPKEAKGGAKEDAPEAADGEAGKDGPAPKKEEVRTTGPAKLRRPVSEKDFDRSEKADSKRDEQIKAITEVLPTQNEPATRAELVFRLAELYWEKSRFILSQEMSEYEKMIEKWQQGGQKGNEPQPIHKRSEVYKKQALSNYQIILEKYPDYPRRDEVLYIMASNQYEAGQKDKAIKNYWDLIKQYPTSDYVGDAYLAMGEHYFNGNDVLKAQKAFKKALETKKAKVYSYALYKLAWCDYNLQEWDGAISKFKKVVDYTNKQNAKAQGKDRDNVQLKSEALADLTLTYSHVEAVDTAYDYLKAEGGPEKARKLTGKLAGYYMDQGKFDSAIQTFRLLINMYPDDPDCPDFQSSIVAAYFKLNKRDEIRVEVKRLVELYRPGTPWWKKNEKNKRTVEKAREIAEERMRELVTDTHQVYTKLKKLEDAELARDMYADYLKVFPDSEYAYRLRFFYAEILWDLGDWDTAATQYDNVVEMDAKNKYKGDYTRQAAYNAILAYEKIAKGEKKGDFRGGGAKGPKAGGKDIKRKDGDVVSFGSVKRIDKDKKGGYEKEEIPPNEVKLAAACDKYVQVVPVNEKTPKDLTDELVLVKFKAGAIYQNHFHFEDAAARFEELIDRWPAHEFARKGADLILDSWDFRENWTELNRVGRKFQKNKNLMGDKSFASRVEKFVEGSSFKEILVLNDKGKKLKDEHKDEEASVLWADCATRFMGFQKEFPTSQFADKAVYNATIIYDNADKLDLAVESAELLLKQYEKSDQVKPTVYLLAQFHERMAEFKRASEYYEQYVTKYPKEKSAPDALYNAALFNQGLGEKKKALELYGKYLKDFKDQSDVADVYWKIAKIYEDDGDFKRAGTLYSEFEKTYPKAPINRIMESRYNYLMALMQEGKKREGDVKAQCEDMLKRVKAMKEDVKKDPVIMRANAHCSFMALEPRFAEFMALKLELPMSKLKKNLEAKAVKLDQLKNDYTAVLSIGDGAWGVAALYRVAVIHHDFAKALKESPDPPGLNPDQLEIYRSELEGQTFPVDEKAIQALEAALQKAFELGIYTEWTARNQDLLKEYKPNEFPPVHSMPFYYSDFFSAGAAAKGGK